MKYLPLSGGDFCARPPCGADPSATGTATAGAVVPSAASGGVDWSVERHVNASLCTTGTSGAYDLRRCPHVERRPVIPLVLGSSLRIYP